MASEKPDAYDFNAIEKKWQNFWVDQKTFRAPDDTTKPKYYVLDMFPYPSGDGLHVGHPEGYTATDIVSRFKRMQGFNVLHPMGWDAFGLPAEQHAMKTGTHPRDTTLRNINRFREQIRSLGFSYDWDREISTCEPDYYKWTQWIFSKLFEKGLAYESFAPVNWCPELGTVLANEEVIDGKSERGGHPVIKKPMRQWVLKITAYAERLLDDLEELDWPEPIKEMQRNWIGKSHGADVDFALADFPGEQIRVFTTRPDTLFGATFMVLAPEHSLVPRLTTKDHQMAVDAYVEACAHASDAERTSDARQKTGVFTGGFAVNPVNGEKIPVYIADYVLATYGHGAIMAVPGHDERDHAFAKTYDLPIKRVLTGGVEDINEAAHSGDGTLVNSSFLDGKEKAAAISAIGQWLEEKGLGQRKVTYKLRDWLFSRQRYWGEPFPIAHDDEGNVVLLPESELPVVLPNLEAYRPSGTGESPLALATDWLTLKDPRSGKTMRRETNTMPQWAGSCWYYLRFIDPKNDQQAWSKEKENYWMPVDLYVGGAEHAVLHLLYARFWHKVLYDCGYVSTKEPFQKLVNQGMILGENGEKMSKSRGNVVNPDDIVAQWGADTFRLYEMFMGPLEASKPWKTDGLQGCYRFLKRLWRLFVDDAGGLLPGLTVHTDSEAALKGLHKTIKKVTEDTAAMHFNTAISTMMEFVNLVYKEGQAISKKSGETLILLLAPYAPHMAEELWERLGHNASLAYEPWPSFDKAMVVESQVTVAVQVNGKVRGTLDIDVEAPQAAVLEKAKAQDSVAKYLQGQTIVKEIYVPGKIVNFVVR